MRIPVWTQPLADDCWVAEGRAECCQTVRTVVSQAVKDVLSQAGVVFQRERAVDCHWTGVVRRRSVVVQRQVRVCQNQTEVVWCLWKNLLCH